jgi:copper(I)-binding protein
MKKLFTILLMGLMGTALAADGVMVMNAWIAEAPPTARMNAAYMDIMNHTDKKRVLTGVTSKQLGHVMMHSTIMEDGVAKMRHMDKVVIEPNQTVSFAPGGKHLMFSAPEKPLKAGDKVDMTLNFANGDNMDVTFTVKKQSGMSGGGHHHH